MTGKMNPMTGSLEEDWETEPHDLCVVWNTMQYHAILSVAFMCIATSAVYALHECMYVLYVHCDECSKIGRHASNTATEKELTLLYMSAHDGKQRCLSHSRKLEVHGGTWRRC